MNNKVNKYHPWFLIFLVALVLRLLPVIAFRNLGIGLDDMYQYDMLARSIATGNGFRWYAAEDLPLVTSYLDLDLEGVHYDPRGILTSFRPPLYPAFLALIYFLTGITARRFLIARLVQAVLAATMVPLTYALASRFFPENRKIAIVAAWIIALYPMLVIYPLSLATENLFFVLLTAGILSLVIASQVVPMESIGQKTRNAGIQFLIQNRWYLASGFLLGLAALTRSVSLALVLLSSLWVWFALKKKRQALLVFVTACIIVAPWIVRNSLLHHRLVGVESALGYDLYVGYHPDGTGTFQFPQSLDLMTLVDDGLRDELGQAQAMEFIKADPARFPYLIVRRAGYFFGLERRAVTYFYSNNYFGYISKPVLIAFSSIICLPFVLVSLSAVFGIPVLKRKKDILLLFLIMGGYILPHLLIIAEDRFHLALLPFLAVLASAFWSQGFCPVWKSLSTRRGKWMLAGLILVVLLLITNWTLELLRDSDKLILLFGPSGNQTYFPY